MSSCRWKAWCFEFPDFWVSILHKFPFFLGLNFRQVPRFLGVTFLVKMAHPRLLWIEVPPPIKLIWTDWNLYQKVIECCLVSCSRKASLLQSDILKFANSLKLPCKQIFFGQTICKQFFLAFASCKQFFCHFWYPPPPPPPVNIKWFVPNYTFDIHFCPK